MAWIRLCNHPAVAMFRQSFIGTCGMGDAGITIKHETDPSLEMVKDIR